MSDSSKNTCSRCFSYIDCPVLITGKYTCEPCHEKFVALLDTLALMYPLGLPLQRLRKYVKRFMNDPDYAVEFVVDVKTRAIADFVNVIPERV